MPNWPIIVCKVGADLLESRYGMAVDDLKTCPAGLGHLGPMRYRDGQLELVSFADGYDGNYVFATERRLPRPPTSSGAADAQAARVLITSFASLLSPSQATQATSDMGKRLTPVRAFRLSLV